MAPDPLPDEVLQFVHSVLRKPLSFSLATHEVLVMDCPAWNIFRGAPPPGIQVEVYAVARASLETFLDGNEAAWMRETIDSVGEIFECGYTPFLLQGDSGGCLIGVDLGRRVCSWGPVRGTA
jgi:hypothetical protein